MTAERQKAINEWLSAHCQTCAENDDRGTGYVNCQSECEVFVGENVLKEALDDQFRDITKKTEDVPDIHVGKIEFKPGDKFILELGAERKMFGEFEIKGTDLYVKTDLLEKLTRYEPISLESAIDYLHEVGWLQEHDRVLTENSQPEQTNCKYCHEDGDGYVTPLEKNCHAIVRCSPIDEWILSVQYGAWRKDIQINNCPMCGRRLNHE